MLKLTFSRSGITNRKYNIIDQVSWKDEKDINEKEYLRLLAKVIVNSNQFSHGNTKKQLLERN